MYTTSNSPSILITGASTGIGQACAVHMAGLGYRVYAGVRRERDGEILTKLSPRIAPLMLDVRNPMHVQGAVERISAEVGAGQFLGLVNNAGIVVAGPLEFVPIGELRKQFDVNVLGLMAVTQAFMPLLRQSRGRIVHIGSIGGKMSAPFNGPYAASKFAVEALTDAMRRELHGTGIEVCLIEPGAIATPIWEKSSEHAEHLLTGMPPEATEYYGRAFDALRATITATTKRADPPDLVARAVAHALMAQTPKTRYLVGSGARIQYLLTLFLPDRALDWAIGKVMGLR